MEIWHGIILGIVEGITEFLPISSTGHLILTNRLLGISETDFTKSFEIIIQLGAILAVVALYWKKLLDLELLKKVLTAFLPTAVIGLLLYSFIKRYFLGNSAVVLWALLIGGIALIAFELWQKKSVPQNDSSEPISYKQALLIGFFQAIAIIPGVSRSAATIIGGLAIGISRKTIVEFSFLLAIPTMLSATGLDLVKSASSFSSDQFTVISVGFVISFVVALASIKFLLKYIQKHDFIPFGVYRMVAATIFFLIIFT